MNACMHAAAHFLPKEKTVVVFDTFHSFGCVAYTCMRTHMRETKEEIFVIVFNIPFAADTDPVLRLSSYN